MWPYIFAAIIPFLIFLLIKKSQRISFLKVCAEGRERIIKEKEKDIANLKKSFEMVDKSRNQNVMEVIDLREKLERIEGEFGVLCQFKNGVFGRSKFAVMLENPSGSYGEKIFDALDAVMGAQNSEYFHRSYKDGPQYREGHFELSKEGREFFSLPNSITILEFPTLNCHLILRGGSSDILLMP